MSLEKDFVPYQEALELKELVSKIYKKHKGKVSYDALHLLICDASFTERVLNIAIDT